MCDMLTCRDWRTIVTIMDGLENILRVGLNSFYSLIFGTCFLKIIVILYVCRVPKTLVSWIKLPVPLKNAEDWTRSSSFSLTTITPCTIRRTVLLTSSSQTRCVNKHKTKLLSRIIITNLNDTL